MRRRFWTVGIALLLVSILLAIGLVGCSRAAQVRAPETGDLPTEQPAPEQAETLPAADGSLPEGEETVVSAATPGPAEPGLETVVTVPSAVESLTGTQEALSAAEPLTATQEALSAAEPLTATQEMSTPEPAAAEPTAVSSESSSSTQQECRWVHKVKKGEWFNQIAREYGVKPNKVMKANDLTRKQANNIHPGQKLCIP